MKIQMQIKETLFKEVLLIQPRIFEDNRGYFYESFNAEQYAMIGIKKPFVQDNLSRSYQHVVRGLHYQLGKPQAKLVSVISGKVFDVVVDIRRHSSTFGQWFGQELSAENHLQLYIPEGFAHGFCVLSESADFMYKCTDYYYPQGERGIFWQDENIAISWPFSVEMAILSAKDLLHPRLSEVAESELPEA